jgi:nitrilase
MGQAGNMPSKAVLMCWRHPPSSTKRFSIFSQTHLRKRLSLTRRLPNPAAVLRKFTGRTDEHSVSRFPEDHDGILYADLDPAMIAIAKAAADPAGHYGRADVARLVVNRERRRVMQEVNVSANSNFQIIPLEDDIAN